MAATTTATTPEPLNPSAISSCSEMRKAINGVVTMNTVKYMGLVR